MLPPPTGIPANFSVKLNSVAKMHTGPPSKEAQMLTAMTTQPKVVLKKLSPEEILRSYQLSLTWTHPKKLKYN